MTRRLSVAVVAFLVTSTVACGPSVDLKSALEATDVFSGWYDNGLKDGKNHLVPSITFRLRNKSDVAFGNVQLTVSFWKVGDDGETDSMQVRGVGTNKLNPGSSTDAITVRASVGYTLEQPRAELFTHSMFQDFVVKMFARRGDKIVPLGEFPVTRQLIPHASTGGRL